MKGKRSQIDRLLEKIEPYYDQMTQANVSLVQQLYVDAVVQIGGQL